MLQMYSNANECPVKRVRGSPAIFAGALSAVIASAMLIAPLTPAFAQKTAPSNGAIAPFARAPATFADIVERVKPAVVSIKVSSGGARNASEKWSRGERRERRNDGPRGRRFGQQRGRQAFPDLPRNHPLNELFKNLPREFRGQQGRRQRPRRSQGSGFVISEDGYVVTNNHVVRGGNQIAVSFDGKENYPAKIVGTDPRTDLALLKIKSKRKFKYVKFATGESRVGDWVVAVGNPFGLGGTVTVGVLSALGRNIGSGPYDYIQIDAAVNRGNSGGPSFNLKGEVIGVNTAIYSPSGGNVGIAFAVPAVTASQVIAQLRKSGQVERGWLGVKIQTISDDIAASLGLPGAHGALISELTPNAPAAKSGLLEGDAILTINGAKVADSRDLARKIAAFSPQSTINVGVRRNGQDITVSVKLGTFPSSRQRVAKTDDQAPRVTALKTLGLDLVEAPKKLGQRIGGVAIRDVNPDSDAAEKGLRQGDVIIAVNGTKVDQPSDVDRIVRDAEKKNRKAVLMTIKRGQTRTFVAIQLKDDD